jgi:RNA polymerase sigma-70 factor, ECF subfamily
MVIARAVFHDWPVREIDGVSTGATSLRHLQQMHGPLLLNYVTRLTRGDVHQAEDIVQETMMRAWRNMDARNAHGHWNRPWLFTVAKHIFIDQCRSTDVRPPEVAIEDVNAYVDPDDVIGRLIDASEVRAAVDALPERLRSTLVEIFYRDRSVAEAADALDVPAGTIKSRTHQAVQALRQTLVSRGFELDAATVTRGGRRVISGVAGGTRRRKSRTPV